MLPRCQFSRQRLIIIDIHNVTMPRLRKIFFAVGSIVLVMAVGLSALWLKYGTSITPDLGNHALAVLNGQSDLMAGRTPGELIRYTLRRLEGHPNLEAVALPPLRWLQRQYEYPVPPGPLPTLGKGQQVGALPLLPGQAVLPDQLAQTAAEIIAAISTAKAGQMVLIHPGSYRIGQSIKTASAGTDQQRITVRANQPGQVQIDFDAQEGFIVQHPYWVFENLSIRGVCQDHGDCEHAFHVVGKGANLVLRNNRLEDFNAHLKINGADGDWPDHGLLQHNTIINSRPRTTRNPTTPFDLVGANHWRVQDNLVSNFVKNGSDGISYGIFMKGASSGGRIERNLVICTPQNVSQPGVRVGISFGGGTTNKESCRDLRCETEHSSGLAANNIVAHCNDSGIDVNQSSRIVIAHNTLINTAGIVVRNAAASATLHGNLLEGQILQRKGGQAKLVMNDIAAMADVLEDPQILNLAWRKPPDNIPSVAIVPADFFGQTRYDGTPPGAISLHIR